MNEAEKSVIESLANHIQEVYELACDVSKNVHGKEEYYFSEGIKSEPSEDMPPSLVGKMYKRLDDIANILNHTNKYVIAL